LRLFSKVFATHILREQCHLAAHHAVKFHEATILSSNVIKSHTLHSKPVLNFDFFVKIVGSTPVPDGNALVRFYALVRFCHSLGYVKEI